MTKLEKKFFCLKNYFLLFQFSEGLSEGEFLMTASNLNSFKKFTSNDEKGDLKFPVTNLI